MQFCVCVCVCAVLLRAASPVDGCTVVCVCVCVCVCAVLLRAASPVDGCTALHRAAEAGRHDNVGVLLLADEALANTRNIAGNTPLHLACLRAHKQTVKTLLVSIRT